MNYDYLIVGAGLFGSVFAHEAHKAGKKVLVVEKRDHIGGNAYTEEKSGINVHKYGAHIFHTDDKSVWDYINQFGKFNDYKHKVIANYKGEFYDLPFNMNTFKQMWGVETVREAREIIAQQKEDVDEINNLEDQCISMVGRDIYNKLVKGYTEKQWGKECCDLPASFIQRLPVRFEYNSNYFDDLYQGIPIGGYTRIFKKMLQGIEVKLNYDFLQHRNDIEYGELVFTGPIDAFFDYCLGHLEYRSLRFETEMLDIDEYQENSVINYTDKKTAFTRIIEHKQFEFKQLPYTIITKEYPEEWSHGKEPFYPIDDKKNNDLYKQYKNLAKAIPNIVFGGRLGDYKYYDMDDTIKSALLLAKKLI